MFVLVIISRKGYGMYISQFSLYRKKPEGDMSHIASLQDISTVCMCTTSMYIKQTFRTETIIL